MNILEINHLQIGFESCTRAVDDISLYLKKGETLGIVGESGSGKTVTSLSIMGLLGTPPPETLNGEILYRANTDATFQNIAAFSTEQLQKIRGKEIAMIFQEPMTSLNPVFKCGHQVTEAIQLHQSVSFDAAKAQTLALFGQVQLPDPSRIFDAYPHQISGGEKQRVMIAMALSCHPNILIADEPTTALDVTVQKAILDLMLNLKAQYGLSMIFISHDLGVISKICDRVVVLYQGKIVEEGPVDQVLYHPEHPYTKGLVACRPSLHRKLQRMPTIADLIDNPNFEPRVLAQAESKQRNADLFAQKPLLEVKNLQVRFPAEKNWIGQTKTWKQAVKNVSFDIYPGETFGLAGESGCGKTTLGRTIAHLNQAQGGEVYYNGVLISALDERGFKPYRREIQVVFQDPYSSLNPRMTIGDAIVEPMKVHQLQANDTARKDWAIKLLETVGLTADQFQRYPHEFSGGQRQRICIARALALEPKFLICDEMVSALDVSVQATVLNLLMDLREQFNLTYLFISHDLSVIKQMCDRIMVMQQGQVEALGLPESIFEHSENEYVRKLIEAIP